MQITAIALVLAERLRDRLREHPSIRQMLELPVIIPDEVDDLPMRGTQLDPVRLGELFRDRFIPVGRIDQKTLIGRRQHDIVHLQLHD